MTEILTKLVTTWWVGENEPVVENHHRVTSFDEEPSEMPISKQETFVVGIVLAISVTFFVAWKITSLVGHAVQFIRDVAWFSFRVAMALAICAAIFNSITPPAMQAKARSVMASVIGAAYEGVDVRKIASNVAAALPRMEAPHINQT